MISPNHVCHRRAAITHCPKGHAYDEANTYRSKSGSRHCRACQAERCRLVTPAIKVERAIRWKRRHPDRVRIGETKQQLRKYGLTPESYAAIHEGQSGTCAICKSACPTGRRLSVDHCHSSGRVRGLLCSNCNIGIGNLRDSVEILRSAIAYLEESRGEA